jgi:hypothetical protein
MYRLAIISANSGWLVPVGSQFSSGFGRERRTSEDFYSTPVKHRSSRSRKQNWMFRQSRNRQGGGESKDEEARNTIVLYRIDREDGRRIWGAETRAKGGRDEKL